MAGENLEIIDKNESKELKGGTIDRVEDSGVNTMEDLSIFLQEQKKEALTSRSGSTRLSH